MPKQLLKTPAGQLQWAQLFEPAKAMDEDKPDLWKVDLVLPWQQPAYELTQQLEAVYMEAHGHGAKPAEHAWPFQMEKIDDKETGNIVFKFKRNTVNSKGRPVSRPVVVDAARCRWPDNMLIGNGSVGIVAFSSYAWKNRLGKHGVSLYLEMVQVIEHVPYDQFSPEDIFDEVEGGFRATDSGTEGVLDSADTPSPLGSTGIPPGVARPQHQPAPSEDSLAWTRAARTLANIPVVSDEEVPF